MSMTYVVVMLRLRNCFLYAQASNYEHMPEQTRSCSNGCKNLALTLWYPQINTTVVKKQDSLNFDKKYAVIA